MRLSEYDINYLEGVKNLILEDLSRHYTIAEIAGHAGVNSNKLKSDFKRLYKTGIFHFLQEKRLEKGKYLLEHSDKTLKEIIPLIGYKHTSSFIKIFKKKYGLTPHIWRSRKYRKRFTHPVS